MARPRAFDHDEARALRASGLVYSVIAERLGVSTNSVARACDTAYAKRQAAISKTLIEAKRRPCRGGCGVLVYDHYASGNRTGYCPTCLGEKRREVNGTHHGTEYEYRYGCRCGDCRRAMNAARAVRRKRTFVPCSHGCGTLVDPYNNRYPGKPPECHPCALKRIRADTVSVGASKPSGSDGDTTP